MASYLGVNRKLIDRLDGVLLYILKPLAYGYARGEVHDGNVGANTGQRHHKLLAA